MSVTVYKQVRGSENKICKCKDKSKGDDAIHYYSKKAFKQIKKEREEAQKEVNVVGKFNASKPVDKVGGEFSNKRYVKFDNLTFLVDDKGGKRLGYVEVNEGEYLEICKSWTKTIIIILLILVLLAGAAYGIKMLLPHEDYGGVIYKPEAEMTQEEKQAVNRQIEFPGFSDMELADGQKITLGNPEKNKVTFEYILTNKDSNKILFTSEKIAPGSGLSVDIRQLLAKGKTPVHILVNTYSVEDGSQRNSMEFNVIITKK